VRSKAPNWRRTLCQPGGIAPLMLYLRRLSDRMAHLGFAPDDELYQLARQAHDSAHRLALDVHYRSCGSGVGRFRWTASGGMVGLAVERRAESQKGGAGRLLPEELLDNPALVRHVNVQGWAWLSPSPAYVQKTKLMQL
jgi:hypothetical protein